MSPRTQEPACAAAAHELALWTTTSDSTLYRQMIVPTCRNMAGKRLKGTHVPELEAKQWRNVSDRAARNYLKEFSPQIKAGDWDWQYFGAATRALAAVEIGASYQDLIADILSDMEAERDNRNRWTVGAIADANREGGAHFFDRATMRFFGDTLASFKAVYVGAEIFVQRTKPRLSGAARDLSTVGDRWRFDPSTGRLTKVAER